MFVDIMDVHSMYINKAYFCKNLCGVGVGWGVEDIQAFWTKLTGGVSYLFLVFIAFLVTSYTYKVGFCELTVFKFTLCVAGLQHMQQCQVG
jgi:hypothetical protein